jgi:ADP-heptose:LPS heptosyltransferase
VFISLREKPLLKVIQKRFPSGRTLWICPDRKAKIFKRNDSNLAIKKSARRLQKRRSNFHPIRALFKKFTFNPDAISNLGESP